MKILALNCGSSSVKYMLYDWDKKEIVSKGLAQRVGLENSYLEHSANGKDYKFDKDLPNHVIAIELIMQSLSHPEHGVVKDVSEIKAVGHRIVHGGDKFTQSVRIDDEVIKTIEDLSSIAPLHNPPNLEGIRAAMKIMPAGTPQVAIFDTAFHQTMPEKAFRYAVPKNWYTDNKIRRYGFHGTSHLYVSKRAAVLLGKKPSECNLITMHIGNGASHTAIKNGISVDTSMGFTPLEGAVMGTRSGDLDPAIPLYMQKQLNVNSDEMDSILNKKSGLLGITGKYADRRDIEDNAAKDPDCELAIEMETYRIKKYIGMYMAVIGKVDAIVFTAGVGENSTVIRQRALEGLEHLGIIVDKAKNMATRSKAGETMISTPDSPVKVFMIPTDEELVFIEDVVGVLNGTYTDHMHYPYTFTK